MHHLFVRVLRLIVGTSFALAVFSACNKSESKGGNTPPPAAPATPPSTESPNAQTTPDFATVQQQIFAPHCFECHSGSSPFGGVNVETYQNVVRNLGRIESEVVIKDDMPPRQAGGPLPEDLQALLDRWVKAGAPQTATRAGTAEWE